MADLEKRVIVLESKMDELYWKAASLYRRVGCPDYVFAEIRRMLL